MKVDYSKPIRFKSKGSSGEGVKATVLEHYPNGFARVSVPEGPVYAGGTFLFDDDGNWLGSNGGSQSRQGARCHVFNEVEEKTLYVRVSTYQDDGDGTSLHRDSPDGEAVASIGLTLKGGIVTGAKLIRSNRMPLKTVQLGVGAFSKLEDL